MIADPFDLPGSGPDPVIVEPPMHPTLAGVVTDANCARCEHLSTLLWQVTETLHPDFPADEWKCDDALAVAETHAERSADLRAEIRDLSLPCGMCGAPAGTQPGALPELPIVKGALDAQADAEKRMFEAQAWAKQANDACVRLAEANADLGLLVIGLQEHLEQVQAFLVTAVDAVENVAVALAASGTDVPRDETEFGGMVLRLVKQRDVLRALVEAEQPRHSYVVDGIAYCPDRVHFPTQAGSLPERCHHCAAYLRIKAALDLCP